MHCKSLWIKASAKCINVNVYLIFPNDRACNIKVWPVWRCNSIQPSQLKFKEVQNEAKPEVLESFIKPQIKK